MSKPTYTNDLWDLTDIPAGTILAEWFEDGVKAVIVRGPAALCAYLGVPSGHPLAEHDHDEIPLDCHGGLTFAGEGDDKYRPEGFYFYGWDYGHAGDNTNFYGVDVDLPNFGNDRKWTLGEVKGEVSMAVPDFKRFIALAEGIKNEA